MRSGIAAAALLALFGAGAEAGGKLTIGAVEEVLLLPWGITLPARIDTGASRSSLDARDIQIKGDFVEFRLPKRHGGMRLRLPLVEMLSFRTSQGQAERPVVELEICVGTRRLRAFVNLNDRSHMTYPFLLGRGILKHHFLVDVSRFQIQRPSCPREELQGSAKP